MTPNKDFTNAFVACVAAAAAAVAAAFISVAAVAAAERESACFILPTGSYGSYTNNRGSYSGSYRGCYGGYNTA